jgi:hypothetical protein
VVLVVYGALILAGALGLLLAPKIVSPLARWRYSRWFATLAADVHRVLLGSKGPVVLSLGCLIHASTIVVVWLVGRAQGLALPLSDAVVLFIVMTGAVVVPISIGGWDCENSPWFRSLPVTAWRRKEHCCFQCASASRWQSARCLERWRGFCIHSRPTGLGPIGRDRRPHTRFRVSRAALKISGS